MTRRLLLLGNKMNVFCDFHHTELYHSIKLLFEDRLGFNLYRPIGMEWQEQGYWKVFDHPATAAQFLSVNQKFDPGPEGLDGKVFEKVVKNIVQVLCDRVLSDNISRRRSKHCL